MRLAPLRQHSAYIHPHGVIHIAGQHVFKTRCVCQGQRYPRHLLRPLISRVLIASLILPTAHADICLHVRAFRAYQGAIFLHDDRICD